MKDKRFLSRVTVKFVLFCLPCFGLSAAHAGKPFIVSSKDAGNQHAPAVTSDSAGNYVVVWQAPDGDEDGIYGRRYAADGSPLGPEFAVSTDSSGNQEAPKVAVDATGRFVISYVSTPLHGSPTLMVRRYAATGVPIDLAPRRVPVSFTEHNLALAVDGTALFVGLVRGSSGPMFRPDTVRLSRFRFDGVALAPEVVLDDTITTNSTPVICARADGSFAVAYSTNIAFNTGSGNDVRFRLYRANGDLSSSTDFGNTQEFEVDRVRLACLAGGGYVTSYQVRGIETAFVKIARFDSGGSSLGEFSISNPPDNRPGVFNDATFAADLAGRAQERSAAPD